MNSNNNNNNDIINDINMNGNSNGNGSMNGNGNYSSDMLLSNTKKTDLITNKGERFFNRVIVASNSLPVVVTTSHLNDSNGDNHQIRSSSGGYGMFNPLRYSGYIRSSGGVVKSNQESQLASSYSLPNSPPSDHYKVKVSRENSPVESALDSLVDKEIKDYLWVGWPHCEVTEENVDQVECAIKKEGSPNFYPIFLDETNIENYYKGYCKIGLWPLIHYQLNYVRLETEWWDSYVQVNQLFCDKIVELYHPGDIIWVHDYHLMLLPSMVKKALGNKVSIGFFFHAPFPSYELFRILPNREELIEGLLGSNLIGFQSFEYLRHFKSSCARLLDLQVDPKGIEVIGEDITPHFVKLQVYPIGVDFSDYINYLETPSVMDRIEKLREIFKDKKVIVARDKLDSIDGVPRKLKVLENLLENYPEWREKLVLIQIYEPVMEQYTESNEQKTFHKTVNEMVGRINGKYGTLNYNPIEYINRKVGMEELTALYKLADIALIIPLRDGMNLTSHEYVVCQKDSFGVLVLSEFTGAARCLGGSIIVNPFSEKEITMAIIESLNMPTEERKLKHSINYNYVMANTSHFWAKRYLCDLYETVKDDPTTTKVPQLNPSFVRSAYSSSTKRIFFLDYDGTLAPLVKHPKMAAPTKELLDTLERLTRDPRNQVYVISGRDRASLEGWLGHLPIGMSCEHGGLFRPPGHNQKWEENTKLDLSWKETVTAIMQDFEDRTPGSFVEYKEINLTWHYRGADPDFSEFQASELMAQLHSVANKYPLDILLGKKAIEVKPKGINKGGIIKTILSKQQPPLSSSSQSNEFIFCCGDDKTDEDMFKQLKPVSMSGGIFEDGEDGGSNTKNMDQVKLQFEQKLKDGGLKCFTVKVLAEGGKDQLNTYAKSLIDSPHDVIELLNSFTINT